MPHLCARATLPPRYPPGLLSLSLLLIHLSALLAILSRSFGPLRIARLTLMLGSPLAMNLEPLCITLSSTRMVNSSPTMSGRPSISRQSLS